jgi:hypothetical protein
MCSRLPETALAFPDANTTKYEPAEMFVGGNVHFFRLPASSAGQPACPPLQNRFA